MFVKWKTFSISNKQKYLQTSVKPGAFVIVTEEKEKIGWAKQIPYEWRWGISNDNKHNNQYL